MELRIEIATWHCCPHVGGPELRPGDPIHGSDMVYRTHCGEDRGYWLRDGFCRYITSLSSTAVVGEEIYWAVILGLA